jgi:hypothetical protein
MVPAVNECWCRQRLRLSKNHSDKRFPVYDELIFKIYTVCVSISCIALSVFSYIPPSVFCILYADAKLHPKFAIFSMLCTIQYNNH